MGWTATVVGLGPGCYELRARSVDESGNAQPEPRPAPTEAAVSDDALLLQFEADVAVDAGRHLVLAKRRAASSARW